MFRRSLLIIVLALAPSVALLAMDNDSMTNVEINNAIERAFWSDTAVRADDLDVTVTDGVATLRGTVNNILAKERAVLLTETVSGVRSVVDLIEVRPTSRTDAAIENDVERALLEDPATDSYEVAVDVEDGQVELTGTVESWHEKRLSETVASGVKGVLGVDNEITIDYRSSRPDVEIQREIVQAMNFDPLVDDGLVSVSVDDGHVSLSGTVGSAAERRRARDDAWTQGVAAVDASGLDVARWARDEDLRKNKYITKPDSDIRLAIEAALLRDPRANSFEIDTSVNDGVVTLSGIVDNAKAKRAAEQDAKNTVGVVSVWNLVKVRPAEHRGDAEIAGDIRDALARSPYVDRFDIDVSVFDGTVYLDGKVDSYYEMATASDIATRVNGTVDVVNRLDVTLTSSFALNPWVDPWLYSYDWYTSDGSLETRADWVIESRIEDELRWSPFVDADEVEIAVDNGVATLTGTVDSYMEKGAARDNAYEAGATDVRNLLLVADQQ